jgi:Hemerythrin HHE cation binding domain
MEILMADAQPDAIALLKADHRKVEDLFEEFEAAKASAAKLELVRQICIELTVHSMIEEEIFYPACKGKIEDDKLNEGFVEHDGTKVLIAELGAGSSNQEFYDSKVKVLSEQIEHHVGEEERPADGIFSRAREAGLDMKDLGNRMRVRKQELMAQYKSEGLASPETRTFTGHDLEQGAPVKEPAKV